MKYNYFILLLSFVGFPQNEKQAVIYDKDDREPIEFVSIYNS